MKMPPSGKRYSIGEIHIFRVSNGQIAEHWHQLDAMGMMSQLKPDTRVGGGRHPLAHLDSTAEGREPC